MEEEFNKLMQEVIDRINEKEQAGELTKWDALHLIDKVKAIIDHGDTSTYGIRCPDGHSDIDDCGWSPSMGYHCN